VSQLEATFVKRGILRHNGAVKSWLLHGWVAFMSGTLSRLSDGPSSYRRRTAHSHLFTVSIACFLAVACTADDRPPRADLTQYDLRPDSGAETTCTAEGCSCEDEGAIRDCGSVKEKVAGYTWCALGMQSCANGKWTACETERIAQRRKVLSRHLLALGGSESCSEENPCEPGCNWFEDTPDDLELSADAGVVAGDAGLSLAQVPNLPGACVAIEVTPTSTTLEISDVAAFNVQQVTFAASVVPASCVDADAQVAWGVDRPDVARISTSGVLTLLQPFAGPLRVSAYAGRLSQSATVDVHLHLQDNSGAPTGMETLLEGPGVAADDVALLYPYEDTVFPLGVSPPKLQWRSVAQVEAVWNGGCALRGDGRVRCWGSNYNDEIVDRVGPYVQMAGRYTHFCALTPSGDAECWGNDSYGQATSRSGPFVQVSAGTEHSCALRTTGQVECWGRNNYGQSNAPSGTFARVSAGSSTSCGVRVNGSVECWGNDTFGQVGTRTGPFIEVSAGAAQVCGIRRDRGLECWGGGNNGESSSPSGAYALVDAGWTHNCALRTDGAAVCWGSNSDGQSVTVAGPFVDVSAAHRHSCGLLGTGKVHCWGNSSDNHTVGVNGGAVKVGLRFPATGTSEFTWSAVAPESVADYADAPRNTVPLVPAPRFNIPTDVWVMLSKSAAGGDFTLTLQRHTGDRLLEPVERRLRLAEQPLPGRITYQSYGTRALQNTTGTFESASARWGALAMSYDSKTNVSTPVAGFTSPDAATGVDRGCRGCHTTNALGEQLITGYDNLTTALLLDRGEAVNAGLALGEPVDSYGGFLWSALHPTESVMFTNSGPSPCATRVDGMTGTCPTTTFAAGAGTDDGSSVLLAESPGGLLGASYVNTDGDALFDLPGSNRFVDLSAGNEGRVAASELPEGLQAALPVFSPEGERLAFVHYGGLLTDGVGTEHVGDKRSLGMLDYNTSPHSLGNFQKLTTPPAAPCAVAIGGTGPCVDVWPSFMANRAGVVFEREVFNNSLLAGTQHADFGGSRSGCETLAGGDACNDGSKGELRWVPLDVDGEPEGDFALTRANGTHTPGQLVTDGVQGSASVKHPVEIEPYLNYQPSAAPRSNGRYTWVAFVSRRTYGNLAVENAWWSDPRVHPLAHAVSTKKLWVTAVDTESDTDDPSAPAFFLEGQEMQGSNGRPVWTVDACIAPRPERSSETECQMDSDCCGAPETASCSLRLPVDETPVRHCIARASACIEIGSEERCEEDENCCGHEAGRRCVSTQCVQPPPLARYESRDFVRDFHAECPTGQYPQWQLLEWQAQLPPGTSIEFTGQTADSADELEDSVAIELGTALPPSTTTWTSWGVDEEDNIAHKFEQALVPAGVWLRVTMTLNPDSRQINTPILTDWRMIYDCRDAF
jgi:hypothetical protein